MAADDATEERTDGPTPAGGAYAVAYWRAANGDPCPKAEAVRAEVIEFDGRGEPIARTYAEIERSP